MTPRTDWLSAPRRASPLVGLALALQGCTPTPEPGPPGPNGPGGGQGDPGTQGPAGDSGTAFLVDATPFDRGSAECPYGGIRYDAGLDDGSNGGVAGDNVLQSGEIDHTDLVCYPAGTQGDFLPSDGPAGTGTIQLSGGDSTHSRGGGGGRFNVSLGGTGGHVTLYPTGYLDVGMPVPSVDQAELGREPLIVLAGTEVAPVVVNPGAESGLADGQVFQFNDTVPTNPDTELWRRRSGGNIQITGIRIEAGGTLRLTRDSGSGQRAFLSVPYDIVNDGTLTTTPVGQDRPSVLVAARYYFGGPSSRITLSGLAGTASLAGGQGGDLTLVANAFGSGSLDQYAQNFWASDTCPFGYGQGGIVNRGVIDVSAGALGANEIGARNGRFANLCSADDVYQVGAVLSRGAGASNVAPPLGGGGRVILRGLTTVMSGAIDVRGGVSALTGASGGSVSIAGETLVMSGSIDASGRDVPITADCRTSTYQGGSGGSLVLDGGWGGVRSSGPIDLHGGDGRGQVGAEGLGGTGGAVFVSADDGGFPMGWGGLIQPGPIRISSTFELDGGPGSGTAGEGGMLDVQLHYDGAYGAPLGQGIEFVGYTSIALDGGDGFDGGGAGLYTISSGEGGFFGATGGEGGTVVAAGGSSVNYVTTSVHGGDASGGVGGSGGLYGLIARMPWPSSHMEALTRAPIDVSGGDGRIGGPGGFALTDGGSYSEVSQPILSAGGSGTTGDGAEGGLVGVRCQFGVAALLAPVDISGGSGFDGGDGGRFIQWGPEVNSAGDVDGTGGAGDATSGFGGEGGWLDVWSSDTWSVVTGDLLANGGTGATPGPYGVLSIDGFYQQP